MFKFPFAFTPKVKDAVITARSGNSFFSNQFLVNSQHPRMPEPCPDSIMDVIKSMPLRLTNHAAQKSIGSDVLLKEACQGVPAICDGSVNEQASTLLPLQVETALDAFDDSQEHATVHESTPAAPAASQASGSLTTLEKLEKLRAALKKQAEEGNHSEPRE